MSSNSQSSPKNKIIHQEFGTIDNSEALERAVPDLPPQQQNLKIQASRSGRKGKTVTMISGFTSSPETLAELLKKLKTQCGSGGTVKDNTIEIQGDHAQKIMSILTDLGYKAKISGASKK